jgi:hypothetical protein
MDNIIGDSSAYGFSNVTDRVWNGNFTDPTSGTLAATGAPAQDQYLFFDLFHPTEAGQSLLSSEALDALAAAPACFVTGTRLLTATGETAVEALRVGDLLCTQLGARLAPIVWIGRRHLDCLDHPKPQEVWPIRISAHAFGTGRPHRFLLLSPDHAVFVDGVLIPIRYLVNGASIAQCRLDAVTYWHVELATHDVILAEGLAAESYLDTGNRCAFLSGQIRPCANAYLPRPQPPRSPGRGRRSGPWPTAA